MGFGEWLTGRSAKEADLYANFSKVEEVVNNIKKINSIEVAEAKDSMHSALTELNNINGIAQFVGEFPVSAFDEYYDAVGAAVVTIGDQIQTKAEAIKEYEQGQETFGGRLASLFSTGAMALTKFGEGIFSVAEDLGDAVVSVVGWLAPKDSGLEKNCEKTPLKN